MRLRGVTLPGLANAHSHAFQRALRGRTQRGGGSFWTWREDMYALAATMTPDRCFELAQRHLRGDAEGRHHDRRRVRLPALQRRADRRRERDRHPAHAARRLLPRGRLRRASPTTRSAASATATPPAGPSACRRSTGAKVGAAIHSVRAVPKDQIPTVVEWAQGKPLHFHLSEQRAENEACLEAHGCTPTELLAELGALGPDSTAVHATHLTRERRAPAARDHDLHVPDDRARPRRRHRPRRAEPEPRQRQPRGDRPVRGGARRRAQPAARHREARPLHAPQPCCAARPTTRASAGPTPAGSSPARSPTSSRSASTRRAWRRRNPTPCSNRSCSRPPRPTSAA